MKKSLWAIKKIITDPMFGLCVVAEKAGEVVGYVYFTGEWSDWRGGVMYVLQGLQTDPATNAVSVRNSLKKSVLDIIKGQKYECSGIRLHGDPKSREDNAAAVKLFDMKPSHYYIYHINT